MDTIINKKLNFLTVTDVYKNESDGLKHVVCRCDCGKIVDTRLSSFLSGHTKSCGSHRKFEDFSGTYVNDVFVKSRGESSCYGKTSTIRYNCVCKCGKEFLARSYNIRKGLVKGCRSCCRKNSNIENGLVDITGKTFNRWTVLSKSHRIREPRGRYVWLWKCECTCGEIRYIRAGALKSGVSKSCGCHKMDVVREQVKNGTINSRMEKLVKSVLDNRNIEYIPQYVFNELRGESGYPLSFDFAVMFNSDLVLLIECQGKQHYEPIDFFGGDTRFLVQQNNDNKKREFVKKFGYDYLELKYNLSDLEIESMVLEKLKCFV